MTTCQATARRGHPCRNLANGDGWCWQHDPDPGAAWQRAIARRKSLVTQLEHVRFVLDLLASQQGESPNRLALRARLEDIEFHAACNLGRNRRR